MSEPDDAARAALEQELLEFHFGCHEDPDAVQARLDADPELRALFDAVRAQAGLLEDAARSDAHDFEPEAVDAETRRSATAPRWRRVASWAPVALVAAAALVTLGLWGWCAFEEAQLRDTVVRIEVTTRTATPDLRPIAFDVTAVDVDHDPVALDVDYTLCAADGRVLDTGTIVANSDESVTWAGTLPAPRLLKIVAHTPDGPRAMEIPVSPTQASPLVHLETDKAVYRPGETVLFRSVAVDRLTLLPFVPAPSGPRPLQLRIVDAQDAIVHSTPPHVPEHGVLSGAWQIPADLAGGRYHVEFVDPREELPKSRQPFVVRRFEAPRLAKKVTLDRASYAPGASGTAEVEATRLAGEAPAGATVDAVVVIDGEEVWRDASTLDHRGRTLFAFTVPEEVDRGEARFVARIRDQGTLETQVKPFVVPTGVRVVHAYPEGGALVAGIAQRVYLEVRDAVGRAVDTRGIIRDVTGAEIAAFETEHEGRAVVEFVPRAGMVYACQVDGAETATPLPTVAAHGVVLRSLDTVTAAGAPVRVRVTATAEVGAAQRAPWTVGVFCRGACVGTETVDGSTARDVAVAVPDSVFGVLRVTVFDASMRPVAERLVQRAPAQRVSVAFDLEHPTLAPGDSQKITLRATDETGAPVQAMLGVAVSDHANRAVAGTHRVGILDRVALLGDVTVPEDLVAELVASEGAATKIDLLLGTQGWRTFVWNHDVDGEPLMDDDPRFAAAPLEGLGRDERSIVSGTDKVAALRASRRATHRAEATVYRTLGLGIVVLLLYGLALGGVALARRFEWSRSAPGDWATGLTTAVAAAALCVFVLPTQFERAAPDLAVAFGIAPTADAGADGGVWLNDGIENEDLLGLTEELFDSVLFDDPAFSGVRDAFGPGVTVDHRGLGNLRFDDFGRPEGPGTAHGEPGSISGDEPEATMLVRRFDAEPSEERQPPLFTTGGRGLYGYYAPTHGLRVYAYRHHGDRERRDDFTETLFWDALLATDADGKATCEFDASDRVTTWDVHAGAHLTVEAGTNGTGRVGQAHTTFDTRLPFYFDLTLPTELTAGDRIDVPVAFIVDGTTPSAARIDEAELLARAQGDVTLVAGSRGRVQLRSGRGRGLVSVEAGSATNGAAMLDVLGAAGRFRDHVRRGFAVVPRGFPHRRSWAGTSGADAPGTFTVPTPTAAEAGSLRLTLQFYPSPLASMRASLEGLLQEPHGCFEQASSTNYPNTLVLEYLQQSGDVIPTAAARAAELLPRGYAKIAGYECSRRGYEWFGSNPGHEALTAYGLLEFVDMQRVYDGVDPTMVERTRDWLLARRDGSGGFRENPAALDSFGGAPSEVVAAYALYALLYADQSPASLDLELRRLVERSATTSDDYELALIGCALGEAARLDAEWADAAQAARTRLVQFQQADGSLTGRNTSITASRGSDLTVETTSFAALAWYADPEGRFVAVARKACEFVQSQQTARGTFGATQATIMALKALCAQAAAADAAPPNGTLRVLVDGQAVTERPFAKTDAEPLTIQLAEHLRPGTEHTISVVVVTEGEATPLPWACDLAYHSDQPADDAEGVVGIEVTPVAETVAEGETVGIRVRVHNRTDQGQPMAIANVGLPAALEVPTEVLDALQKSGAFEFWEIRGRTLSFYWRDLAPSAEHSFVVDCLGKLPGTTTAPAANAYLYYTPDMRRWAAPFTVRVEADRK